MSRRRGLFWILSLLALSYVALRTGAFTSAPPSAPPAAAALEVPAPGDPSAPSLRVLFIGNSLTYAGNLTAVVQGLARTAGVNLVYEKYTPGGARLLNHASDPHVRELLARGGWDAVVLQEQSQWPAFADAQVRSGIEPYATALADEARRASPSVRILLYETPARRGGDPQNAAVAPALATYEGMQLRIDRTYGRLAVLVRGEVVPAGEAWRIVVREHPEINLYDDAVHPGPVGAYLIACVFHATLLGRSPVGSAYTAGLDPAVAAQLQAVAWRAVSGAGGRR